MRALAFMHAASVLRSYPFAIRDAKRELKDVKLIGPHALRVASVRRLLLINSNHFLVVSG